MEATIAREPLSYTMGLPAARPASLNRETYASLMGVIERKDNTWLQLDVCPSWRETGRCPEAELCCHAHPPPHLDILESNRVVACYDDVKKGACRRKDCKFFHPPNHLKNVVNTNGRNNLRLRNELKQQFKVMGQPQPLAQAYYTQEVGSYPTPLYYPSLPYPSAYPSLQATQASLQASQASMQATQARQFQALVPPPAARVDSPPTPPGELPDWQLVQAAPATSDSPGKTPPRATRAHSPTLKFHPYVLAPAPGTRKTSSKKEMFVPQMLPALTQSDLMQYYQHYTQPYMVPQQMLDPRLLYVDPSTFSIPPITRDQ